MKLPYTIKVVRWTLYIRHFDGDCSVFFSHAIGQELFRTRREARTACNEQNATQLGWTSIGSRFFVGKLTIRETTEHAR